MVVRLWREHLDNKKESRQEKRRSSRPKALDHILARHVQNQEILIEYHTGFMVQERRRNE
jgi:hypothetical protein